MWNHAPIAHRLKNRDQAGNCPPLSNPQTFRARAFVSCRRTIKQPSGWKPRVLKAIDWKSTILNKFICLLLFDVFFNQLVVMLPQLTARSACAQNLSDPQILLRRCGNSCSSTRGLVSLSHCMFGSHPGWVNFLERRARGRVPPLPGMISSSCSAAICGFRSRTRTATSRYE